MKKFKVEKSLPLHALVAAIQEVIIEHDNETFVHAGQLVRCYVSEGPGGEVVHKCVPYTQDTIASRVSELGVEIIGSKGQRVHLPQSVARNLLQSLEWSGFPVLRVFTDVPFWDGECVVTQPGYHEPSATLYAPATGEIPEVPLSATHDDALASVELFRELLSDFPFKHDAHLSSILAAVLTPLLRSGIRGPIPILAIDAAAAGTGKSKLADIISLLSTGQDAARHVFPERGHDAELVKQLTAAALEGDRILTYDNVNTFIKSAALDAHGTARVFKGRALGSNSFIQTDAPPFLVLTGNNLAFHDETRRRLLYCRMVARSATPHARGGFRFDPIEAHVRGNRAKYVAAALTIRAAYQAAGCPSVEMKRWGSYEAWSEEVRRPLVWVGLVDPVVATEDFMSEEDDDDRAAWASVRVALEKLSEDNPRKGVTAFQLLRQLNTTNSFQSGGPLKRPAEEKWKTEFEEALQLLFGGVIPTPDALGRRLGQMRDRNLGGWRIVRGGLTGGSRRWVVEMIDEESPS